MNISQGGCGEGGVGCGGLGEGVGCAGLGDGGGGEAANKEDTAWYKCGYKNNK